MATLQLPLFVRNGSLDSLVRCAAPCPDTVPRIETPFVVIVVLASFQLQLERRQTSDIHCALFLVYAGLLALQAKRP